MATHVETPHPGGLPLRTLVAPRRVSAGVSIGAIGVVLLAAPLVIYDWVKAGHAALELPMGAASWVFGLEHFAQNEYRWWPIVIGAALLMACWMLAGLAFAGLADRVFEVKTLAGSIAAGFAWGVASFLMFWSMLLAIARDGAPLRETAAAGPFVAPNWVWVLGFLLSGLAIGIGYRALRERATH